MVSRYAPSLSTLFGSGTVVQVFAAFLAFAVALAMMPDPAEAQDRRGGESLYIKLGAGLSNYAGDGSLTRDFEDFFDEGKFSDSDVFPYMLSGELGYQFTPATSVNLGYQFGQYPFTDQFDSDLGTIRHTINLSARYTLGASSWLFAPYADVGANLTFGGDSVAGGPSVGLGVDVALSQRTSLFLESRIFTNYPDDAVDGFDGKRAGDALNALPSVGIKFNFSDPTVPVEATEVSGPDQLATNEEGIFEARVNEDADEPLEFMWNYGDGTTDMGLMTSKSYVEPGEYEVTFTARGPRNEDTRTTEVTVLAPAEIVTIDASPMPATEGEEVTFTSNVEGSDPLEYEWTFGDGTASGEAEPTHTYDEPGEYEVALSLSNPVAEDQRTLNLEVEPALADVCLEITEFNSAFFERNSSALTDEGREAIDENAEILNECPNLDVRVEGFASEFERDPDDLSEDRADAVAQYYEDAGVAPTRIDAEGAGAQEVDKADEAQFHRTDSAPVERDDQ